MKNICILLALMSAVCVSDCFAQRKGDVPYTEAKFLLSQEPMSVVLQGIQSGQDMTIRTMTLYGDGRVDFEVRSGPKILKEFRRTISQAELEHLIKTAVEHGLAEWDNGRIRAHQLAKRGGKGYASPSDAVQVTVLISLQEYQRGTYVVKDLTRTARVRGPEYAARVFPEIPEFTGILAISRLMNDAFNSAHSLI